MSWLARLRLKRHNKQRAQLAQAELEALRRLPKGKRPPDWFDRLDELPVIDI